MRKLYAYSLDCGRMGDLDGLFIADDADIEKKKGSTAYFGEVLGKHSDIADEDWAENLTVKSDDQDFIAKFEEVMGAGYSSGHNPLDYIEEDEE